MRRQRRFTASRGGKHTTIDRLDKVGFLARTAVAMVVNMAGLGWLLHDQISRLPLFAFLALAAFAPCAVMFVGNRLIERVVRPRLFDREQRHHEIVPSQPEEKPTHA